MKGILQMIKTIQIFSVASILLLGLDTKPIVPVSSKPIPVVTNNINEDIPENVKEKLPDDVVIEKPINFKDLINMYNACLVKNVKLEQENKMLKQNTGKEEYNKWHISACGLFILTLLFTSYLLGKQKIAKEKKDIALNTKKPKRIYSRKTKPKDVETTKQTKQAIKKKPVKKAAKKNTVKRKRVVKKTVSRKKEI